MIMLAMETLVQIGLYISLQKKALKEASWIGWFKKNLYRIVMVSLGLIGLYLTWQNLN